MERNKITYVLNGVSHGRHGFFIVELEALLVRDLETDKASADIDGNVGS